MPDERPAIDFAFEKGPLRARRSPTKRAFFSRDPCESHKTWLFQQKGSARAGRLGLSKKTSAPRTCAIHAKRGFFSRRERTESWIASPGPLMPRAHGTNESRPRVRDAILAHAAHPWRRFRLPQLRARQPSSHRKPLAPAMRAIERHRRLGFNDLRSRLSRKAARWKGMQAQYPACRAPSPFRFDRETRAPPQRRPSRERPP